MARNQRRRVQEALFSPAPSTTPPDEEKAAELTETQKTWLIKKDELKEFEKMLAEGVSPIAPAPSPADYVADKYGIAPNCTNVPRLLYAILCEVVRGRA